MNHKTSAHEPDGLVWFKSSYSDTSNPNDCVEVATAPGAVHVRDSKDAEGPCLVLGRHAWARFSRHVASGG
ncbi:DUF397 domain-containing protein [Streptomyces somaliensis]|uniref:DUF397 domain-containing protein n=1 Tax=Streptomyces somaliensis TaxID=78355 RepID=UPI0020CF7075|nr:DUF397 domain-containing protein [Streptomyces somaliensis]MCP9944829.1 DUF397 domain-containing protein [Streptomyces somaliensis]MCP9961941.1 DUF397 domain-containing protein [Streptomyces somaliensis]MCP9974765.1 DUF397 domain-containing protein [Streptomyces somaliensis]